MHCPHPMHLDGSRWMGGQSSNAPPPHHLTHAPQAVQSSVFTFGTMLLCCSYFPARAAQPIPIFFIAPPIPQSPCPLKCAIDKITSALYIASATFIFLKCFRFASTST